MVEHPVLWMRREVSINNYAYAGGNSLGNIDPLGMTVLVPGKGLQDDSSGWATNGYFLSV